MLLSHHAACDFDRTWCIAGVRVCTRCLGVVVGAGACEAFLGRVLPLGVACAFAVPGMLDYTLHELHVTQSSNRRRVLTGVAFGAFVATLIAAGWHGDWRTLTAGVCWFVALQFAATWFLFRAGRVEEILQRYENAARSVDRQQM